MRVLVACEESQAVCIEFRKRGHEAYSCDIQECSGGHPEWHIKGDVLEQLDDGGRLVIPVGPRYSQMLQVWERTGSRYDQRNTIPVSFVPLRGEKGWSEKRWFR